MKSLEEKTFEKRTYIDKNGIDHTIVDYYSNCKTLWMACRRAIGSNFKEDVEEWLDDEHLTVMDGGNNGKWYICFDY